MLRLAPWVLLTGVTVFAGRRRDVPEVPAPAAVSAPRAVDRYQAPLFPPSVVVDPGPVPAGLAGLGGQTCAACHPGAYESWRHGGHSRPPPDALEAASVGLVGCDVCHRPLAAQRQTIDTVWGARLEQATSTPNPNFDAGSWLEGVTCVACHVRDGAVLTADEAAAGRSAPHPMRFAPALADGTSCAACHQLSVPESATALYDTWGEFERSGFAAAGVTCNTCHGRAAAEAGVLSHDPGRPLEHALSIGLRLSSLRVVRGAAPVAATVRLQNTGAGHAVPTGSPWRRIDVHVFLEGPPDKAGHRPRRSQVDTALARELTTTPPFEVTGDTRLQPGALREVSVSLELPTDVPAAGWELVVEVVDSGSDARFERRWPLLVE